MLGQKDSSPVAGQGARDRWDRRRPAESAVQRRRTRAQHAITDPVLRCGTVTQSQISSCSEVAR